MAAFLAEGVHSGSELTSTSTGMIGANLDGQDTSVRDFHKD